MVMAKNGRCSMDSNVSTSGNDRGGKYLTFMLGGGCYGVEIMRVREIIGVMPITCVPRMPAFIKGVINLRGKVIPVVDLRLKFGMEEAAHTSQTCIIVVQVDRSEVGVVVDKVCEVLDIDSQDVDSTPSFGGEGRIDFILGIAKTGERVTILLDISRVLGEQGICDGIASAAEAPAETSGLATAA